MSNYRTNFSSESFSKSMDMIRAERNLILNETVDRLNPIRWSTLSDAKKVEWENFRKKLLNITTRIVRIDYVEWPQVPSEHDAAVTEEITPDPETP